MNEALQYIGISIFRVLYSLLENSQLKLKDEGVEDLAGGYQVSVRKKSASCCVPGSVGSRTSAGAD